MLQQVLVHALHRAGNGVGAAAGQGITGVGGKGAHLARGHMQASGAGFQCAQHDAVARQDEAAQELAVHINAFHRHGGAHHHHHQRPCRAPGQHMVARAHHGHPPV